MGGSPDRILRIPTYGYQRVYARQRPGGVAWDAVPLTVCGLNKAAGNLPLLLYYYLFQIILKPIQMPHNKYVEILCNTSYYYNNQYYTILQNTTQILPNTTHR